MQCCDDVNKCDVLIFCFQSPSCPSLWHVINVCMIGFSISVLDLNHPGDLTEWDLTVWDQIGFKTTEHPASQNGLRSESLNKV